MTQASTITGISTERLTDLLDEGVISSYYEGLLRIVSFSSLADYIQSQLAGGAA